MTAQEIYKIAQEARPVKDEQYRLTKYIEFLERDILRSAKLGLFKFNVNYNDRIVTNEFVFKIQEYFQAQGFNIIREDDVNKYREFIISWEYIQEQNEK